MQDMHKSAFTVTCEKGDGVEFARFVFVFCENNGVRSSGVVAQINFRVFSKKIQKALGSNLPILLRAGFSPEQD